MVVRGVEMWSGLAGGDLSPWGPLVRVTNLCGLTLDGGMEEDLCGPVEGPEARQPARDRQSHLRLVSHRMSP